MQKPTKLLKYNHLDSVMCRPDKRNGGNIPVSILYCTKEGEVIEESNVVCTSVDHAKKNRRVKFMNTEDPVTKNKMTRTLRDCLILQVDEFKIIKS